MGKLGRYQPQFLLYRMLLYVTEAIKAFSSAKIGTATNNAHTFACKFVTAARTVAINATKAREAG